LSDMAVSMSTASSEEIADVAGVNSAQVRKDLSYLGSHGTRGVGYDIDELRGQIRKALGLVNEHGVVIVGAGNLGSALANYKGFENWGFTIAAVVDVDDAKIGTKVDGVVVESMRRLEKIVSKKHIKIGIIATPPAAAQGVADRLMSVGIKSILNLAPATIKVTDDVSVRRVDLSTELGILAYHLKSEFRKAGS
ncbi:MAG: redox-sensing transcriptional repressor Rex, partial [Acidimicrobiia bacterium]|nr:redox-sensing transcriptional repressor Rex [Acidimicrobiia bacterium]